MTQLRLPDLPTADAIWGATGRDSRGHTWLGVSIRTAPQPSAYLVEHVPETGETMSRGDVVSELKRCGVYREGETQSKIHSRIEEAEDGHLYLASTDVAEGDRRKDTKPPTWGGHLWRLRLPENRWEHLLSTPEGLIALSVSGRFVYALGYFGHRLYQYDCRTGKVNSVEVGAVGGHISRNLVSDHRGHVYVPRLRREPAPEDAGPGEPLVASLVEYDTALTEVGETTLDNYIKQEAWESHGLTAFQPMIDGSIIVMTHRAFMYRIVPEGEGLARVEPVGWLHPGGARYGATLFTYAGERYVMGLTKLNTEIDWVVYDLETDASTLLPFNVRREDPFTWYGALLYGSATRDDEGRAYVVGVEGGGGPTVLQVSHP